MYLYHVSVLKSFVVENDVSLIVIDRDTSLECNCCLSTFKLFQQNYDIIFDILKLLNKYNNKYKTCIAHIQYKYFHMRITDNKIKINK